MKYLRYKDIKNRKYFSKAELKAKINKVLFINFLKTKTAKSGYLPQNFLKKVNSKQTRINSRCLLSNNNRSMFKRFRLSRCKLRELVSLGKVLGYTKAVW